MVSSRVKKITCSLSLLMAVGFACTAVAQGRMQQGLVNRPRGAAAQQQEPIPEDFPTNAPGEILVSVAAGVDAQALAAQHGLQVKKALTHAPNIFLFHGAGANIEAKLAQLAQTPGVLAASPNYYRRLTALPQVAADDPLQQWQWPLRMLNATDFWGISVGERLVNGPKKDVLVGLIDAGPETSHPDLWEVFDEGWDAVLGQPYDETFAPYLFETHGTAMAGCIAGTTNNGVGLASLPWEAVKIVPCRTNIIVTDDDDNQYTAIPDVALVDALYYCIDREVDVINMSLGGFSSNPVVEQAIQDAYDQGIVLVASSGNERQFFPGVNYPAAHPEVIAISAVGPLGEIANYSSAGPEVELAAPGGNDPTGLSPGQQVLMPDSRGFSPVQGIPAGYAFGQGTSPASAYASGVIATLITQGALDESLTPTEQVEALRQVLRQTARNPLGTKNNDYGYGIINPVGALQTFSQYVDLLSPGPNEITESFAEPVQAVVVQPNRDLMSEDDIRVFANKTDVTEDLDLEELSQGNVLFQPESANRWSLGANAFDIVVENLSMDDAARSLSGDPVGRIPARAMRFRVRPRVEEEGTKMLSIPYTLQEGADRLEFLFGGNLVRTARWRPQQRRYAYFDVVGSPQDPEADLLTEDAGVATPPVGIGFFARVRQQTQVQLLGASVRQPYYEIPLQVGFNMIGNPYPFRIPWSAVTVKYGNEIMSVGEAANRNLMRPTIWRYLDGRYQFQMYPNGELVNWEAHWVRAFRQVTLVIPRVQSVFGSGTISSAGAGKVASTKGWNAPIRAEYAGKVVGEVVLGMASGARDGAGPEDVENPPLLESVADLRIANNSWGQHSGRYQQDIRATNKQIKRWTLELETSEAGKPVTLTWDRFPTNLRAYLQDPVSGKILPLTRGGSLSVKPVAGRKVQRFTVIAVPVRGA